MYGYGAVLLQMSQTVLATLWQIFDKASEGTFCFLVFTPNFIFCRVTVQYWRKLILWYVNCKCFRQYRQPFGKFAIGVWGFWQLFDKFFIESERILAISWQCLQRVLATFVHENTYLSRACQHPPSLCYRVLITSWPVGREHWRSSKYICIRIAPLTKEETIFPEFYNDQRFTF